MVTLRLAIMTMQCPGAARAGEGAETEAGPRTRVVCGTVAGGHRADTASSRAHLTQRAPAGQGSARASDRARSSCRVPSSGRASRVRAPKSRPGLHLGEALPRATGLT